jgi:hypothetical protein
MDWEERLDLSERRGGMSGEKTKETRGGSFRSGLVLDELKR